MSEEFESQGHEVVKKVLDAALAGDMQAATLVLQRISPPLRPRAESVHFALDPAASLFEQGKQVLAAIACGDVDPETGRVLISCLTTFAGLKQVDEFDRRLAALEGQEL